jgi:Flp pilus assembly protein TadB
MQNPIGSGLFAIRPSVAVAVGVLTMTWGVVHIVLGEDGPSPNRILRSILLCALGLWWLWLARRNRREYRSKQNR